MGEINTSSRQYQSGPQITFVTVDLTPLIGGAFWDIPVSLPFPCNTFFIASIKSGDDANNVLLYFQPTNHPRAFSLLNMFGSEQVFALNSLNLVQFYRAVLRFKEPVTSFFLAIGSENGHLSCYTIGCCKDDDLQIRGGIYT